MRRADPLPENSIVTARPALGLLPLCPHGGAAASEPGRAGVCRAAHGCSQLGQAARGRQQQGPCGRVTGKGLLAWSLGFGREGWPLPVTHASLVLCGLRSCVELNRSSFLEPEGLLKARKSVFVTRKLTVSVGEVVNGGPLPPTPRHTPVCSFNSQNKYVGESLAAELPASAQRASSEAAGERAAASGGFSGAGAWVSARVRVCASAQRPAVALRPARRGSPAPRCLFPRRAHAPRPAVGSPWGRRLSPVPLYSLPCRRGPRRRVQCRGGRAPAGPPPTACAGACRPASAPGPGSGRPGRRARPLPAPRAAPRAAGAASCSAGARVLRRGEVCRPASEGHVACGVPVSAERATKGVCVCPGTFRASCGGSQSGTWPAGSACVSDEEPEAPRAGTTRGSLARRPCLSETS